MLLLLLLLLSLQARLALLSRFRSLSSLHARFSQTSTSLDALCHASASRPHVIIMMRDAAIAVSIFTTGDLVAQQIEHGSTEMAAPISLERTASASALGLIWGGGISPTVYRLNERLFPGRHPRQVLKKIAVTTTLLGCLGNWSMIFSKRMLTGEQQQAAAGEFCRPTSLADRMRSTAESTCADWATVMSHDLKVWPLTDVIVFSLVPVGLRVALVSSVSVCWQTYLSYTASRGTAAALPNDGRATTVQINAAAPLRRTVSRPPELKGLVRGEVR